MALAESPGFCVIANASHLDVDGVDTLHFDPGDKIEVLTWSKRGWWWGRCALGGRPGWFPSALVRPAAVATPPGASAPAYGPALPPRATAYNGKEVWPPLPPGPPPAPLPAGAPPADDGPARAADALDEHVQTLSFLRDGRVSRGTAAERGITQMNHYFNYGAWVDAKSREAFEAVGRGQEPRGRPTGDGGIKRCKRS
uniref:SH3 domain-containing protein n=1 Tax=Zooxanthella nutricula TaxID=1333877 RepID=A0A6U6PY77_9DINO|mmetsp:Transcript_594/g.1944  ORF Transcript_594/g.1944 Transcript_594/m.1944 type:complete len:198 (+) Transcript_594:56-649(+)